MQIIMKINLKWRLKLFNDEYALKLFKEIILMYNKLGKEENFIPIFTFLPQKDDLLEIKKSNNFLKKITDELKNIQGLVYFDVIEPLIKNEQLDELYSDNNDYGGHFSKKGNEEIAKIIKKHLDDKKLLIS